MNAANPYLKQYKQNQIETATPEQILILLYDGAIQYLNRAKIGIETDDNIQFHTNILFCEKIIMEFMNTLDMELGGKFADRLYALYEYLYNTLVSASISKNVAKIDEVLRHLSHLRETWLKAIEIASAEKEGKAIETEEYHCDTYNNDSDDDEEDYDEDEEEEEDEEE